MSNDNHNPFGGPMSQFTRTVTIRDVNGNSFTQTVTDRNAVHSEQRRLASARNNLRSEYVRTMANAVVLTPQEQSETGYYGRVFGVEGDLGTTDEAGWCWLTFPEWKEVIKATRAMFAADDVRLAKEQSGLKAAAYRR
jgi:hypothetical protein